MGIGKVSSLAVASLSKVNSLAKLSIGKISGFTASFAAAFSNTYSLNCDGSNDYVTMGDINILDGQDTFTISTWINLTALPEEGYRYAVVTKDNAYELYVRNYAPDIKMYLRLNNGSVNVTGGLEIVAETWYHVVAVHKSGGTDIYLNAEAVGSGLGSQITVNNTVDSFIIGGRGSYFTNGLVDEVALWTTDLDADAITQIYNSGAPIDLTSNSGNYDNSDTLVGYWRMEEGTGTSVADSSTNSNAGTLTNFSGGGWSSTVPTA